MRKDIIILNAKERKLILKDLEELFGINILPEGVYFCFSKKEKVYLSTRELFEINSDELRVNTFGLHFGTFMKDGFRLSLEGLNLAKDQITKHLHQINDEEFSLWLQGEDLEIENKDNENTYLVIKHEHDLVGVGKLKNNTILNYLSKSRKLKKVIL
ncbi:MAG: hypothetical protein KC535_04175 [Nanoarchaeota archaeon]|nr:hypothetical protein [Nanoarchaeota archaeon]